MKHWWLVIALLLSLGLNLGLLASRAWQHRAVPSADANRAVDPVRPDGRIPRVVYRMADELELKDAKRDAFVEIQRTFFEQTVDARGRMAYLQGEVRREITSDSPDRETLDEILTELSAAHIDLERAFVTNLLETRDLLDVEQEQRYRHFLRRMRQVRSEVERRFRDRWRGQGEHREWRDLHRRGRPGLGRSRGPRFGQRPQVPPDGAAAEAETTRDDQDEQGSTVE